MKIKTVVENELRIILDNKAMLSGEIVKCILEKYNTLNKNTVKSIVCRSKILIRSENTYFHCQYAYILKKYSNKKDDLFERMYDETNSSLKFIIKYLSTKGKFISLHTFAKLLCIDSKEEIEGKLTITRLFRSSISNNNIYVYDGFEEPSTTSDFYNNQKLRLLACKILLYKHHADNFIQINKVNYLGMDDDKLIMPSSLYGIRFDAYTNQNALSINLDSKVFVVYDFGLSNIYTIEECKSFIERIMRLKNRGRKHKIKVLPIAVYEEIDSETLYLLHKNAILCISFESFLTKGYKNVLGRFLPVIYRKGSLSPIDFKTMIDDSIRINIFENIKGYLFEYLCYEIISSAMNNFEIYRNVKTRIDNKTVAQFDMVLENDSEKIYCECKAVNFAIVFGKKIKEKVRINTILYTLNKMEFDSTEKQKKILYITTSKYHIVDEENKAKLNDMMPTNVPFTTNILTFTEIETCLGESNWVDIWRNYFR